MDRHRCAKMILDGARLVTVAHPHKSGRVIFGFDVEAEIMSPIQAVRGLAEIKRRAIAAQG